MFRRMFCYVLVICMFFVTPALSVELFDGVYTGMSFSEAKKMADFDLSHYKTGKKLILYKIFPFFLISF